MSYEYYYTDDIEKEIKNIENSSRRPANYGLAVAALVIGVISLVFFLFILNIFSAVAAIIMGFIFLASAGKGQRGKGLAITGILTALLSIVLCIGSYIVIFQNADNISKMMENELKNDSQFHYYQYDGSEDPFEGEDPFGDYMNPYEDYDDYDDPFKEFEDLYDLYRENNGLDDFYNDNHDNDTL